MRDITGEYLDELAAEWQASVSSKTGAAIELQQWAAQL
jgi:hypothetical protein